MSRLFRFVALIAVLAAMLTPLGAVNAAPLAPHDQMMPRYFPETGFWLQGHFRQYWESRGGLFIFGYPITGVFEQDGFYRQYFERAVFEYHPQHAGTQYEVQLMLLGSIRTEDRRHEAPFQPVAPFPDTQDHRFFPETGHSLSYGFKNYWETFGGLQNFGFSLSQEFDERNQDPPAGDGQVHTVQYFERARFEYHPEHAGTPYEVLLGLLGQEYLAKRGAPAEATARQDPQMPPYDPIRNVQYGPHVGYGFNAFLRGDDQPDAAEFNQRSIDLLKQAEFSWVRFQLRWETIELAPGSYDLFSLDRIINPTAANGVKMIASVVGPPPAFYGTQGIPADTSGFQQMMQVLAERYRGKVQAWEIWNEQNLASNVGGRVEAAPYVNLLKAGYNGVKAGDPGAIVLLGATTPTGVNEPSIAIDDVNYLRQVYAYNGGEAKQYYDALAAHPGSNNNPPDTMWPHNPGPGPGWTDDGSFYFRRIEQLRQVMVENGEGHKQIWLTEFGWTTANLAPGYEYGHQNSPQDQANYLVRAFEIGKQEWPWIGVMAVWQLNFAPISPPDDERHPWGVLDADWNPRPSYEALRAMPK